MKKISSPCHTSRCPSFVTTATPISHLMIYNPFLNSVVLFLAPAPHTIGRKNVSLYKLSIRPNDPCLTVNIFCCSSSYASELSQGETSSYLLPPGCKLPLQSLSETEQDPRSTTGGQSPVKPVTTSSNIAGYK